MTVKPTIVRLTRHFDAPPEIVFDAWLDSRVAGKWLFTTPSSESERRAEIDARVGGSYVFTDRRDGEEFQAVGEYLEIDRPRCLVFTFAMPQFSPDSNRIVVEIAPAGADCVLELTHEGLPAEYMGATAMGWGEMFDALAEILG